MGEYSAEQAILGGVCAVVTAGLSLLAPALGWYPFALLMVLGLGFIATGVYKIRRSPPGRDDKRPRRPPPGRDDRRR